MNHSDCFRRNITVSCKDKIKLSNARKMHVSNRNNLGTIRVLPECGKVTYFSVQDIAKTSFPFLNHFTCHQMRFAELNLHL